jgi:hypothetical protein
MKENTITVRGKSYLVRELSGADMIGVRKLIATPETKVHLEAFVAWKCCLEPKFETQQKTADSLPFTVMKAISEEAFRLGNDDPTDPKEETPVAS